MVQRYEDGRSLFTGDSLPQSAQIHRTQRAIVEAVAGLTRFAPDHASMIRADRTAEARLVERCENGAHVDISVIRWVCRFLKRMRSGAFDVAAVGEVNASSAADAANDLRQIVPRICRERSSAKSDAVRCIVDEINHPLERRSTGDNARKTKNRPRRIVRMQRHVYSGTGGHRHYALEKMGEI